MQRAAGVAAGEGAPATRVRRRTARPAGSDAPHLGRGLCPAATSAGFWSSIEKEHREGFRGTVYRPAAPFRSQDKGLAVVVRPIKAAPLSWNRVC
jgi:hypothetical protein